MKPKTANKDILRRADRRISRKNSRGFGHRIKLGVRGEFDLLIRGADGIERHVYTGSNLITNTGMNWFFTSTSGMNTNWGTFCRVGSGSTTPAFTDIALATQVASVARGTSSPAFITGWVGDATYAAYVKMRFDFATGAATGNLQEVGLGDSASDNLKTRALFVDGGGTPITVTVLADEALIVIYRIYFTPNTADSTLTVSTGPGPTSYDLVMRPYGLNSGTPSASAPGGGAGVVGGSNARFYTGLSSAIGSITSSGPSGTMSSGLGPTLTKGTYTTNSFTRTDRASYNAATGNLTNIGAMTFPDSFMFLWQIGITPRFTKTNTQVVNIDVTWSIARV